MSKKQFFAIVDTETTAQDTVADFAIIICDRQGKIYNQAAVLVREHFDKFDLFFNPAARGLWSREYAQEKRAKYNAMLDSGSRMLASVTAINNWINQAIGKYDPVLTAYNLSFDIAKCENTDIDLSAFSQRFCLWQAAIGNICHSKKYRQFALEHHAFNNATEYRNMTFKTNAETVCGFVVGEFKTEPHTALEDARDFELPILQAIAKRKKWQDKIVPYNWRDFQVKDNFVAR